MIAFWPSSIEYHIYRKNWKKPNTCDKEEEDEEERRGWRHCRKRAGDWYLLRAPLKQIESNIYIAEGEVSPQDEWIHSYRVIKNTVWKHARRNRKEIFKKEKEKNVFSIIHFQRIVGQIGCLKESGLESYRESLEISPASSYSNEQHSSAARQTAFSWVVRSRTRTMLPWLGG